MSWWLVAARTAFPTHDVSCAAPLAPRDNRILDDEWGRDWSRSGILLRAARRRPTRIPDESRSWARGIPRPQCRRHLRAQLSMRERHVEILQAPANRRDGASIRAKRSHVLPVRSVARVVDCDRQPNQA